MKIERIAIIVLLLALMLTVGVRLGQAQVLAPGATQGEGTTEPKAPSVVSRSIPIQGRLTNASGAPLNGYYDITMTIYDDPTAGTARCTDTDSVLATDGLFSTHMEFCEATDINGDALYLGIKVGSDPEMIPRQSIYPVPYAFTVVPGAVMSDTVMNHPTINNSTINDPVINRPFINNGTFKGIVKGDTSYLHVPGIAGAWEDETAVAGIKLFRFGNGRAKLTPPPGGINLEPYYNIPISLPSVLYGQPVRLTEVTIYYHASGTGNYITYTSVGRYGLSGIHWIAQDTTDSAFNTLSADEGIIAVGIQLHFTDTFTQDIYIDGVRATLVHNY